MLIGQFQQLYDLIKQARSKAIFFVNQEHLNLYWQVGADIDAKLNGGSWGDKVVEQFAEWLNKKDPGIKNFDRRNIYRMREFFLAYANLEIQHQQDGLSFLDHSNYWLSSHLLNRTALDCLRECNPLLKSTSLPSYQQRKPSSTLPCERYALWVQKCYYLHIAQLVFHAHPLQRTSFLTRQHALSRSYLHPNPL